MIIVHLKSSKGIHTYLTSITENQKDLLYQIKGMPYQESSKKFKELTAKWGIDCTGIIKIGKVKEAKGSSISPYVTSFPGKDTSATGAVGHNRETHYRDYTVTEKKQRESMHLIIKCSDATSSGRSALSLMKDEWCIVWETMDSSIILDNRNNLNGNTWYKRNI